MKRVLIIASAFAAFVLALGYSSGNFFPMRHIAVDTLTSFSGSLPIYVGDSVKVSGPLTATSIKGNVVSGSWLSNVIALSYGGTNNSTGYQIGKFLKFDGTSFVSSNYDSNSTFSSKNILSVGATGQNLSGGSSTYTTFGCIGIIPNNLGTYRLYLAPGTIKNMHCNAMATGGSGTCSITIYKNGSGTSLACSSFTTLNASYGTEQTDLNAGHAFTIAAGDYIEVRISPVSYSVTQFYCYVEYYPS